MREQAIREDKALLDSELRQEEDAATQRALNWLTRLEGTRRRLSTAPTVTSKSVPPTAPPATTLKISVRFVPVTVVLRDPKGNAIGNLKKEGFELFDNGKPQEIKTFSIEKSNSTRVNGAQPATTTESTKAPSRPDRYVAYLFDDIHISFEDLPQPETLPPAIFPDFNPVTAPPFSQPPGRSRRLHERFREVAAGTENSSDASHLRGAMCPPITDTWQTRSSTRTISKFSASPRATPRTAPSVAQHGRRNDACRADCPIDRHRSPQHRKRRESVGRERVALRLPADCQRSRQPQHRSRFSGFLMLEPEVREAIAT